MKRILLGILIFVMGFAASFMAYQTGYTKGWKQGERWRANIMGLDASMHMSDFLSCKDGSKLNFGRKNWGCDQKKP